MTTLDLEFQIDAPTADATKPAFKLTEDQENALSRFTAFLADPNETAFVISGYAGCGKSTLVKTLLDRLPRIEKMARLLWPEMPEYDLELSATTNKAAEALAQITGSAVATVHSVLGLQIKTDYKTRENHLVVRRAPIEQALLFVDEASFIDSTLLGLIFQQTKNCKIVFIGDPAQLAPVKGNATPVFSAKFDEVRLTKVMRQAEGNPIIDLATRCRNWVNTGKFLPVRPDGHHIQHLDWDDFAGAIKAEFLRKNWKYSDSKILAWTNKKVIAYNDSVRELVSGKPEFEAGDYAISNSHIPNGSYAVKTDQTVHITRVSEPTESHEVTGRFVMIDGRLQVFVPDSRDEMKARRKKAIALEDHHVMNVIEYTWADLRAMYACTINKSQGSTFDKVFIDLNDVRRCNSTDQIARMLYVAVSRARHQVIFTGDLA